jgi:hypothetical protein
MSQEKKMARARNCDHARTSDASAKCLQMGAAHSLLIVERCSKARARA